MWSRRLAIFYWMNAVRMDGNGGKKEIGGRLVRVIALAINTTWIDRKNVIFVKLSFSIK